MDAGLKDPLLKHPSTGDSSRKEVSIHDSAEHALKYALEQGAREAAVTVAEARQVEIEWRDGQLQKMSDSNTRSLSLALYLDGRYASMSTSDLRANALHKFIDEAVALTKSLAPDPFRSLPDPKLYEGQAKATLEWFDPAIPALDPSERRRRAEALEAGVRSHHEPKLVSVTTAFSDAVSRSYRIHSNGFSGEKLQSVAWQSASVSLKEEDGRRPEEDEVAGTRFLSDLPDPHALGQKAMQRAQRRLGAKKLPSQTTTVVFEPRVAAQFLGSFIGPLAASSLQQKRSFFAEKINTPVGSSLLNLRDDPFLPRGLGSRLFDGEGLAAKVRSIVEQGVLKEFFVDNYYGKKLGMPPNSGSSSNLVLDQVGESPAALLAAVTDGFLVTGFLGGNSNSTTGDFSFGFMGHHLVNGESRESVAEMNLSGNHLTAWQRLVAVGNDPHPYGSLRMPTLVFSGMAVAGT